MAKQRISTLFVSLWQSRAMIFCTILRSLLHFGLQQWRRSNMSNTCPKFQTTWVCFTCHSAEKKCSLHQNLHPAPSQSPCNLQTWSMTSCNKRWFFFNRWIDQHPTGCQPQFFKSTIDISKNPTELGEFRMNVITFAQQNVGLFLERFPNTRTSPFNFYPFFCICS